MKTKIAQIAIFKPLHNLFDYEMLEIHRERYRIDHCNYWVNLPRSKLFKIATKVNIITRVKINKKIRYCEFTFLL